MNRALIPTVLVLLLGPGEARAQSTPKQAAAEGAPQPAAAASAVTPAGSSAVDLPSLRISITSANDSRTDDGKGNLLAVLSIAGDSPFSANTLIRRVAITRILDNRGRSIPAPPVPDPPRRQSFPGVLPPRTTHPMVLGIVPRNAEVLTIDGWIEFYAPSEANGGIIRVADIGAKSGRVPDARLREKSAEVFFYPDQSRLEAAVPAFRPPFSHTYTPARFPNTAAYFVVDPGQHVLGYQLVDRTGSVLRTNGSFHMDGATTWLEQVSLPAPLPADAQLMLFVNAPDATRVIPFRIEDFKLP